MVLHNRLSQRCSILAECCENDSQKTMQTNFVCLLNGFGFIPKQLLSNKFGGKWQVSFCVVLLNTHTHKHSNGKPPLDPDQCRMYIINKYSQLRRLEPRTFCLRVKVDHDVWTAHTVSRFHNDRPGPLYIVAM